MHELIHDWADTRDGASRGPGFPAVAVNDETLRDGLQSPSVTDPTVGQKLQILHLMEALGIENACVGLPGAGRRQREAVAALCREIAASRLHVRPGCAGRTHRDDVTATLELRQETGVDIEVCMFLACSPIRRYAESWDVDDLVERTRAAVAFAVREGADVMFVTEDTTRSAPETLRSLYTAAIEAGAKRICLCDTVGCAVPAGTTNLVRWARGLVEELGVDVSIDWHGHRDRGLGLANTLAAAEAGATRLHATALGVGERVGNAAMEEVLVNLRLLGLREHDLGALPAYVDCVSRALGVPVPPGQPIVGRDAFRTATGVHAAAIRKARSKGEAWLVDNVYSGVPASWLGRAQEIEVGPMSGAANVLSFLERHGLPAHAHSVERVLAAAKRSNRTLEEAELLELLNEPVPGGGRSP
jgi:2-isopropylmalate synthase